jgi:ubiquinone/menaquinone biosynthesis C-methylase UbiE
MKLHIGSGDKRFDGFVNVDYDANCNPDYCFDIETQTFPFEDNSVDEVIAHHVFEHLGEGYFHVLKQLYRVCQHGAIIDVVVPHHRHDSFANDPTHRRPITPDGLWLFSKKYNDICVKQGAASSRLGYYFDVDFEVVDVQNIPDQKYIEVFTKKTIAEVEQYMQEHNNIIVEVHMKLVVIKEYAQD